MQNISTKDKFPVVMRGVKYNIYASYPTTSTEVYEYKLEDVTHFTATVTYVDDTKEELVSVEWT